MSKRAKSKSSPSLEQLENLAERIEQSSQQLESLRLESEALSKSITADTAEFNAQVRTLQIEGVLPL